MPGRRFINYRRLHKIIDIDFLVDEVFAQREPLNFHALRTAETKVIFPLWNTQQGAFDTFYNQSVTYDVLRAAKALPIVYGKKVSVNGQLYCDHSITTTELVSFSKETENILIIDTQNTSRFLERIEKILSSGHKTASSHPKQTASKHITIQPTIDAHLLTRTPARIEGLFEAGKLYCYHYFTK